MITSFTCPACKQAIPVERFDAPMRLCRECRKKGSTEHKPAKKVCLCGARRIVKA